GFRASGPQVPRPSDCPHRRGERSATAAVRLLPSSRARAAAPLNPPLANRSATTFASSSVACLSGLIVLIFDAPAGARFQAREKTADIAFVHAEDQRLLLALGVRIADGDVVSARLAEQQQGGNQDGGR